MDPLIPENQHAVLDETARILERLGARLDQVGEPMFAVLDADDLDAMRRVAGIFLAFLSVAPESCMELEAERSLRSALLALYPLMEAVARNLFSERVETNG